MVMLYGDPEHSPIVLGENIFTGYILLPFLVDYFNYALN